MTSDNDESSEPPQSSHDGDSNRPTTGEEMAVVSDTVRQIIADVDVKAAVATLKEGKFLLKYCRNSLRKVNLLYCQLKAFVFSSISF